MFKVDAHSSEPVASQPNPVWVRFDPEADAAYIGLAVIGPGEAVRQVIVEGVPNSADIVLDFNSSGQLLGVEVIGARAVLSDQLLAFGGQQAHRRDLGAS
jgi:uncharacterized protein YuzE